MKESKKAAAITARMKKFRKVPKSVSYVRVEAGVSSTNYGFYGVASGGKFRIYAGCRTFTPAQAMRHWDLDKYIRLKHEWEYLKLYPQSEQTKQLIREYTARCKEHRKLAQEVFVLMEKELKRYSK